MADDSAPCPYCGQAIEPKPKRSRKCPHCNEWVVVRRGNLVTPADAAAVPAPTRPEPAQEPVAPPAEDLKRAVLDELKQWLAEELKPALLVGLAPRAGGGVRQPARPRAAHRHLAVGGRQQWDRRRLVLGRGR